MIATELPPNHVVCPHCVDGYRNGFNGVHCDDCHGETEAVILENIELRAEVQRLKRFEREYKELCAYRDFCK